MVSPASAWQEREVSIDGGKAPLFGTLATTAGNAARAQVLILAGSGPTDRDGNQHNLRNDSLKLLARALVDQGIASLRIDKRGIGASFAAAPAELELRVETYVEDAVRWLRFLDAQPNAGPLVALGHSEGALIATMAAAHVRVSSVVLISAAGFPAGEVLERQLAAVALPPALRERTRSILASLLRGETVADVPDGLAALFRPSVQPYLVSYLRLDPAAELAKLSVPALIVQGTTDLQVTLADARRLAGARRDIDLVVLEGANHVLKEAPAERAANLQTYNEPGRPLAPGLVPAIADFIGKPR